MSRYSRRSFVKKTAAAAAVVSVAPYISNARAESPNAKMGVAIVGAGSRGGSHVGGFLGDSRTDIDTARNAGLPVIGVTFGYTDIPVEQLRPDVVIDHFDRLEAAVAALAAPRAAVA